MADDPNIAKYGVALDSGPAEQGRDRVIQSFKDILAAAVRNGSDVAKTGVDSAKKYADAFQEYSNRIARQAFPAIMQAIDQTRERQRLLALQIEETNKAYERQRQFGMAAALELSRTYGPVLPPDFAQRIHEVASETDILAGSQTKVAAASNLTFSGFGRIRQGLTSLIASMTGTIPVLDRIGGQFLAMRVGGNIAIGVIAGIAAIALAYHYLTLDAREAAKAQDESLKKLEEWDKKKRDEAAGGAFVGEVAGAKESLGRQTSTRNVLSGVDPDNPDAFQAVANIWLDHTRQHYATAVKAVTDGEAALGSEISASYLKRQGQEAAALADLIKADNATHQERLRAAELLKQDQALLEQYTEASQGKKLSKEQRDAFFGLRDSLTTQIGQLQAALHPENQSTDAAAAKLDHVRDAIRGMHDEAANFGKDGAIDSRLATIGTQLDNLGVQSPALAKQIVELRTQLNAAGEAMKAAQYSKVASDIHAQLVEQQTLTAAIIDHTGSVHELTAAQKAAQEIRQREAALGSPLQETQRYEILAKYQTEQARTEALTTAGIREQRQAIEAENAALASGAASRKDYQANLEAQVAARKALETIGVSDPVALAARLAEIESLRQAKVAHVQLTEAAIEHDKAMKQLAEDEKQFASEQQRVAQMLEQSVLHAIRSFTTTGIKDFRSFFGEIEQLSLHMIGQLDDQLSKLNKQWTDAMDVGAEGFAQDISDEMSKLEKLNAVAKAAAVAVSAALGGYQVGQQLYSSSHSTAQNNAAGALGGAASGAMAGSAFGPWGAATGAVVGLTAGIIGMGHAAAEAAKQTRELMTALSLNMDALRAEVAKDSLAQSIASVNANREQLRKQIEEAWSGGDANSDRVKWRTAQLAEMNALEDQRIQQLRDEAAAAKALAEQQKKRDAEDLSVRLLAAQGHAQESSDAAFRNQQQREYQDAVAAKRSPEYLALLTATQVQEAIQRATQRDIENQTQLIANANRTTQAALDAQLKTANDTLKVNQDALRTAEENARALQQVVDNLKNFKDSLKLSTLSPLSPIEQLAEAKRQLDADYAKAQGGDLQAGSDFANLAKAFLTASREVNASGTKYANDFATVQQMTDALQGKFGPQLSAQQQIVAQLTAANAALQAQINAIQAAKEAAQKSADAQTAALTAATDAQTAALIAGLEKNRNAALLPADSLLNALSAIATNVTGAAQSTITAEQAALLESRNAAEAAANAQIAAIREGKDAATLHSLATINELQATRLASNMRAISIEAELIKNGVLGQGEIDALVANRQAANDAAVAAIAAVRNGSDAATQQSLAQIAAMQQHRLEAYANATQMIGQLTQNGALGQGAIDVLRENRQAADAAANAAIAAMKDGSSAARQDTLKQIAVLEQSRLDANASAYAQETALAKQRTALDQQITEAQTSQALQAAQTEQITQQRDAVVYSLGSLDAASATRAQAQINAYNLQLAEMARVKAVNEAHLTQMVSDRTVLDAQLAKAEEQRRQADEYAKSQIAVLAAIRDKNWTPTIVFTPPPPDRNAGNPNGYPRGGGVYADGKSVPMMASGGYFGGGMRLVGERGPELEFTGPSRIVSASQTGSLLADALGQSAEMAAELRDLNDSSAATVALLQAGLSALVRRVEELAARVDENTKVTKRGFEGMS